MKHLVKKYILRVKVGEDVMEVINKAPIDEKTISEISNTNIEGYHTLGITEDNDIIQTFKYTEGKNIFIIPEPNPIVIYFDTARTFHKIIQNRRKDLFGTLTTPGNNFYALNGDFYWYFSTVSSYIIFLFLSIEAFVNKIIPNDFEYRKNIQDRKTELYDKYQIQRSIEFLEKIKKVVPAITNKNFIQEFGHKYELIKKLKEYRDEIIHTKSFEGKNSPNFYENLYANSLNFEFDKTLFAVRDYINYHEENLIEECECGNDY